jgi:hypothetical protein
MASSFWHRKPLTRIETEQPYSGPHIVGRIDLIVPRVIIMKGRTQPSSRGCGTNLVLCRCLAARRMDG